MKMINDRWMWHAKGGEYISFKPDVHLVVDWSNEGRLIEVSFAGARIKKTEVYFRPGITYSRRSAKDYHSVYFLQDVFAEKRDLLSFPLAMNTLCLH